MHLHTHVINTLTLEHMYLIPTYVHYTHTDLHRHTLALKQARTYTHIPTQIRTHTAGMMEDHLLSLAQHGALTLRLSLC